MTSFSDVAPEVPEDAPKLHDTFEVKNVTLYSTSRSVLIAMCTSLRSRVQLNAEASSTLKQLPRCRSPSHLGNRVLG